MLLPLLPGKGTVLPILVFSLCALGIGNSNYWAIAQHAPPETLVGRAIGFLNTISQAAGAAAPLVTGWLLGPSRRFGPAILVAGICSLFASGLLLSAGPSGLDRLKRLLSPKELLPEEN